MRDLSALVQVLSSSRVSRTRLPDGSGVVLDTQGLQVISLNATGYFVVEQLAAALSEESEILQRMMAVFDVDEDTARRDLAAFLARVGELFCPRSC